MRKEILFFLKHLRSRGEMMGRITDYDSFAWCYTCDHMYSWEQYNRDANMCKSCALVTEREEDD